ncbi:branched-chain amino acid ABC transporter permease [Arthrobacter castelli]|uniref:branched-chain amino acid ABC transporter permease n=1 Tax=Arthrobacter castelli TaxID=271431 RepID=UPI00040C332F|nr:branched-chain amino acid ABC transporter permease [Arthrobacter castelli]
MDSIFLQLVVDGLANGAIYAALALAIVLVHRATGMINFAQGAMAVMSTFLAWSMWQVGLPAPVAILVTIVISMVMGAAVERLVIRRFEQGSEHTAVIVTVGLLVLFTGLAGLFWGYTAVEFPSLFPLGTLNIAGAFVSYQSLGNIAVLLLVVLGLQLLFKKTKLGLALRAVADNPESSSLSGIPVGNLLMVGWGLAAALGALAGALIAPKVFLDPHMLDQVLVYALAAAILGGLNSPLGAVVAAMLIGVVENLAGHYITIIGDDLKIAVPLIAMFIILLVRPQGLFGQKEVVRV